MELQIGSPPFFVLQQNPQNSNKNDGRPPRSWATDVLFVELALRTLAKN